jgi:hypothetical protein
MLGQNLFSINLSGLKKLARVEPIAFGSKAVSPAKKKLFSCQTLLAGKKPMAKTVKFI